MCLTRNWANQIRFFCFFHSKPCAFEWYVYLGSKRGWTKDMACRKCHNFEIVPWRPGSDHTVGHGTQFYVIVATPFLRRPITRLIKSSRLCDSAISRLTRYFLSFECRIVTKSCHNSADEGQKYVAPKKCGKTLPSVFDYYFHHMWHNFLKN